MSDPITTTVLAAAGGAATKELVGKAWDSGKKWLSSYFENHQPEAQIAAQENAGAFLNSLTGRLDKLERDNPYNKEFFSKAFKEPSFSVLLQKAILNAAQTKDAGKHKLLSKLVAEKLLSKEESTHSLASQMACDAIAFSTEKQLRLLGLCTALIRRTPNLNYSWITSEESFYSACESYANAILDPLAVEGSQYLNLRHLESLSCLKVELFSPNELPKIISTWKTGVFAYSVDRFYQTQAGLKVRPLCEKEGILSVTLTSVGMLVGFYVIEVIAKAPTNLSPMWTE